MKKANKWRILGGIGVILLFSARMYVSYQQKQDRALQEQMIHDLSRKQYEQQEVLREQMQESLNDEMVKDLQESRAKLDSIGKSLESNRLRFDSSMKLK